MECCAKGGKDLSFSVRRSCLLRLPVPCVRPEAAVREEGERIWREPSDGRLLDP